MCLETELLILLNFNQFTFKQPYVAGGYSIENTLRGKMCGARLLHCLKQPPGSLNARSPDLSWYPVVTLIVNVWSQNVGVLQSVLEVRPCFFRYDIRVTEEFLVSVLLELLSEIPGSGLSGN